MIPFKDQILNIIQKESRPLDISYLAEKLYTSWWGAFKAVADILMDELQEKFPDILHSLSIVPIKTTKSWVVASPSLFALKVLKDDHERNRRQP